MQGQARTYLDLGSIVNPVVDETAAVVTDPGINGVFRYIGSNGVVDGGVVVSDSHGMNWQRIIESEPLKPEWWGAIGDRVHDDTAAFQDCIDFATQYIQAQSWPSEAQPIYLDTKVYRITRPLQVRGTLTLIGGQRRLLSTTIKYHSPNGPHQGYFHMSNPGTAVLFDSPDPGSLFEIRSVSNAIGDNTNVRIEHIAVAKRAAAKRSAKSSS